jgi:pyrimidine-specific ribonucleoside hydrolase
MILDFVFDLETSDPDDIFALCILATHPSANLVAVTVHPGGRDQVALVRHILKKLDRRSIPVGADMPTKKASRVSAFHYDWLRGENVGRLGWPDGSAVEVLKTVLESHHGHLHLVTGAALTNIANTSHASPSDSSFFFAEWTGQGGFAGDSVVPPEYRLPKFAGKETCPTFNLGGDYRAALELLRTEKPHIPKRRLVPKNVCHGIFYNPEVDARIPRGHYPGLDLLKDGMAYYFKGHPGGKALHDVIAAVVAIEPSMGTWVPVELYRTPRGEWGSRKVEPSPEAVEIMVALDLPRFERVLTGVGVYISLGMGVYNPRGLERLEVRR